MKRTHIISLIALALVVAVIVPTAATAEGGVYLPNPIKCPNVTCVLTEIIRIVLGFLGIVATFMFIYGGIMFMVSGGNPELVKKGKDTLKFSSIGIVIILVSWAIVRLVLNVITKGTT